VSALGEKAVSISHQPTPVSASHTERARLTVTKESKTVPAKPAQVRPALADDLAGTVKRGYL
jgi:hypothetical protein